MQHKKGKIKNIPFLSSALGGFSFEKTAALVCIAILPFFIGCKFKKADLSEMTIRSQRRAINDKFPKIPKDEILQQTTGNKLYIELEERYKATLASFKTLAENDCVKLVVVVLTPEVGKGATLSNTFGIPYIIETCSSLNIDCIDLSTAVASNDYNDMTLMPEDTHWSKNGSSYVANLLTNTIFKYNNIRNTKTYKDTTRPKTFGDLPVNDNEVLHGEMNLPYRLKVNAQGLRMDHNLTFPKKKQTILFLGNANLYSPYLDNEFIATTLLQNRFPDKEIVNAGFENYTLEDYLSLYVEKAKYMEPDLVIICTDGDDILNYYFTQRNHFSRLKKSYTPSNAEKTFYIDTYNYTSGG